MRWNRAMLNTWELNTAPSSPPWPRAHTFGTLGPGRPVLDGARRRLIDTQCADRRRRPAKKAGRRLSVRGPDSKDRLAHAADVRAVTAQWLRPAARLSSARLGTARNTAVLDGTPGMPAVVPAIGHMVSSSAAMARPVVAAENVHGIREHTLAKQQLVCSPYPWMPVRTSRRAR